MIFKTGLQHYNWKGGRTIDNKGYVKVMCKGHRKADDHGRVKEHRLVYEQYYNVCLLDWTDIHHINGIKDDNRIENLQPILHKTHTKNHQKGNKYWLGKKHREETKKKMSIKASRKRIPDRLCMICNHKTYTDKDGHENWYKYKDGHICLHCNYILKKEIDYN